MVCRGIENERATYHSKAELLLFVDKEEVVAQLQVEVEFDLTKSGARSKLYRLWHKGSLLTSTQRYGFVGSCRCCGRCHANPETLKS